MQCITYLCQKFWTLFKFELLKCEVLPKYGEIKAGPDFMGVPVLGTGCKYVLSKYGGPQIDKVEK